jgi:hypothetical protein
MRMSDAGPRRDRPGFAGHVANDIAATPGPHDFTTADAVAQDVAARLADPATMAAAVEAAARQSTFTEFVRWRPHSVASGYAGAAIVFGAADARWPGAGWDRAGHRHLGAATAAMEAALHVDSSLYAGLAGLGFAAEVLAAGRDRYRRLTGAVDAELLPRIEQAVWRLDGADGGPVATFDLISGLSGAGVYLLARRADPAADRVLRLLLSGLARLLSDRSEPRRWHTPAAYLGESMRAAYPHGNLNCGLAHGLPGPLALLAIAARDGVEVAGMTEAIAMAADWLAAARIDLAEGPDWPNALALPSPDGHSDPRRASRPHNAGAGVRPGRVAWCYGSPGVARSLWLAGTALDDARLRDLAVRTMRTALARPAGERLITSPTFCHGTAGLLQITMCFARDTRLPEFIAATADLTAELLGEYEPASILGYRDVEPGDVRVDQPSLLDGAPGVALALIGASAAANPAAATGRSAAGGADPRATETPSGSTAASNGTARAADTASAALWERLFLLS